MDRKNYFIGLAIVVGIILLDQVTKSLVANNIAIREMITIIPSFLYLTHHVNPGAAWGMLPGQLTFFVIVTIIALGIFVYLSKDMVFKEKPFYSMGVVLLIGGTIGNFIDRLRLGHVIDFIDVYIFGYNFPVFNVADMALTIGWIALAIDLVFLNPQRSDADA